MRKNNVLEFGFVNKQRLQEIFQSLFLRQNISKSLSKTISFPSNLRFISLTIVRKRFRQFTVKLRQDDLERDVFSDASKLFFESVQMDFCVDGREVGNWFLACPNVVLLFTIHSTWKAKQRAGTTGFRFIKG